jgi:hypothetical protein
MSNKKLEERLQSIDNRLEKINHVTDNMTIEELAKAEKLSTLLRNKKTALQQEIAKRKTHNRIPSRKELSLKETIDFKYQDLNNAIKGKGEITGLYESFASNTLKNQIESQRKNLEKMLVSGKFDDSSIICDADKTELEKVKLALNIYSANLLDSKNTTNPKNLIDILSNAYQYFNHKIAGDASLTSRHVLAKDFEELLDLVEYVDRKKRSKKESDSKYSIEGSPVEKLFKPWQDKLNALEKVNNTKDPKEQAQAFAQYQKDYEYTYTDEYLTKLNELAERVKNVGKRNIAIAKREQKKPTAAIIGFLKTKTPEPTYSSSLYKFINKVD